MDKNFTPGPWFVSDVAGHIVITSEPQFDSDQDLLNPNDVGQKAAEKNAHLMAAAPDMYSLLSSPKILLSVTEQVRNDIQSLLNSINP